MTGQTRPSLLQCVSLQDPFKSLQVKESVGETTLTFTYEFGLEGLGMTMYYLVILKIKSIITIIDLNNKYLNKCKESFFKKEQKI